MFLTFTFVLFSLIALGNGNWSPCPGPQCPTENECQCSVGPVIQAPELPERIFYIFIQEVVKILLAFLINFSQRGDSTTRPVQTRVRRGASNRRASINRVTRD